jgi:hypothetical protein
MNAKRAYPGTKVVDYSFQMGRACLVAMDDGKACNSSCCGREKGDGETGDGSQKQLFTQCVLTTSKHVSYTMVRTTEVRKNEAVTTHIPTLVLAVLGM